jgi:hypothetical protein
MSYSTAKLPNTPFLYYIVYLCVRMEMMILCNVMMDGLASLNIICIQIELCVSHMCFIFLDFSDVLLFLSFLNIPYFCLFFLNF